MKSGIIWGMGQCFKDNIHLIKYHEVLNQFKIIGVTANESIYSQIYGYDFIGKSNLLKIDFDFVVVMAYDDMFNVILNEALNLGLRKECIFPFRVLKHQNFDIDKYLKLKKNPPSIFSNLCWGGITYHSLGLEFTSPLINMFEEEQDYIRMIKEPKRYMNEVLEFVEMRYEPNSKKDYPVVKCGDITLHFNHYDSFISAKECWERRKRRIDWDNLFIMMYTENFDSASEFLNLSYEKKICFVPFYSNEKSLVQVEFRNKKEMEAVSFWEIVNGMASGMYPYYDVFDLIENAKITKLVDFI